MIIKVKDFNGKEKIIFFTYFSAYVYVYILERERENG